MRQVAGTLRLDLAQYRAMAAFAQFAADLDKATQQQLHRGSRLVEILKQGQFAPMPVEHQVAIIWAGANGYLDDIPKEDVRRFEAGFHKFLEDQYGQLLHAMASKLALDDEITGLLAAASKDFKAKFLAGSATVPASLDFTRNELVKKPAPAAEPVAVG